MSTHENQFRAEEPMGESQDEYEVRRRREVDEIIRRSKLTVAAVKSGQEVPEFEPQTPTPPATGRVEFSDPDFRATPDSHKRNAELVKSLAVEDDFDRAIANYGKDEAFVLPPDASADEELLPITTIDLIQSERSGVREGLIETFQKQDETEAIASLIDQLKVAEEEYKDRYNAEASIEAIYKARLQEFNLQNAELLNTKKETSEARVETEEKLKTLLEQWAIVTGEKKFDEYLSVKEFVKFDIDEAAATTWAETNYPAAINKITNYKLLEQYLKTAKQSFDWAERKISYVPQISKKFVQTGGEV